MYLIIHIRYVDNHRLTVLVHLLLNGQAAEVLSLVVGNLLSVHGERLREVSEAIEETYGHHIHIGVRSLLHVVTSQDSQTSRVNLKSLVQTIFHAKVSHAGTILAGLYVHIRAELLVGLVHALEDILVLGEFGKTLVGNALQHEDRVLSTLFIKGGIQAREKAAGTVIPSPPHIVSQFLQFLEFLGDATLDDNGFPLDIVGVTCFDNHIRLFL